MLGDKTVLERSVASLLALPAIEKLVIAVHAEDAVARTLPALQVDRLVWVTGGDERVDSVLKGLLALRDEADTNDWVLVHDAARPCLRKSDAERLMAALAEDAVGGILAVPAIDTLKRVEDARIALTVDRSVVWQAQTPQMFRYGLLLQALQSARSSGLAITDEASAMETCGYKPAVVQGSRDNIKITYIDDLALANFYLRAQQEH